MENVYFLASKGIISPSLYRMLLTKHNARALFTVLLLSSLGLSSVRSQSCSPISTLNCSEVAVSLPYSLSFSGTEGGLKDKYGKGTGFTMVDKPSAPLETPSNPSIPGYEPSRLEVVGGVLKLTTTRGIAYRDNSQTTATNSQVNALGVGLRAAQESFNIETTILQPSAGIHASEQAGLWYGLDEDNYVTFKVVAPATGQNLELLLEVNAYSPNQASHNYKSKDIPTLSSSVVKLKLFVDTQANTIEGFYSLNGSALVSAGKLVIPRKFIDGKMLSDGVTNNVSFAGIYATHRRGKSLVYAFDEFKVTGVKPPAQPCSPISTLNCSEVAVSLPYSLSFSGTEGGLKDKYGKGTGFTMVDKPSAPLEAPSNPSIPGYEPSRLEVVGGVLKLTTTRGIAYRDNSQTTATNSQVNALGVGLRAAQESFNIETTILQPSAGIHASEQAGLWYGLDEDNYVTFKVVAPATGQNLELLLEVNAYSPNQASHNYKSKDIPTLSSSVVKLKLFVDTQANTIEGFYSLNGAGLVSAGKLVIPRKFIDGKMLSDGVTNNVSFAGIYATHRRGKELAYFFDDFKVTPLTTPSIVSTNPRNGALNVSVSTSISTDVTNLPNSGIDNATLTSSSVRLVQVNTNSPVPATVNGSGGRDVITLVPDVALAYNTQYRFEVNAAVKDLNGVPFQPYASTFTTVAIDSGGTSSPSMKMVGFTKVALDSTNERHSCLTIGPDRKLYAVTIDGRIKRFPINADGTLGTPQIITSLQTFSGGQRLVTGFTFDRSATASNPVCWVTHSSFVFEGGPTWDGKISKLSGPDLQTVQLVVVNLPRSVKDHVTNGLSIGPDGALYVSQPSNSAMGREDATWGNRLENLLSATILRLNLVQLPSLTLPINAKTTEAGGTYDPYAAGAPLTIYACGVRNAFDLIWHSNGELYAPTNGSASGGNTPASVAGTRRPDGTLYNGPTIPALTKVTQTQKDFLFRIVKGGYYGHPNSLRGQYVLNGGNPTSEPDFAQVDMYPVGTLPDANYRGAAFDFQLNKSPNGVVEYRNNAFSGALKGKLLVVRYSQNNDIIILEPDPVSKNIINATEGFTIPGLSGFRDPLDITADSLTGNLYVSEYDASGLNPKITLLKPTPVPPTARVMQMVDTVANPEIYDGSDFWTASEYEAITVSPNPFKDVFSLYHLPRGDQAISIKLYDMMGKKVFSQEYTSILQSNAELQVRMADLASGVYILKVHATTNDRKEKIIRIVKQ